MPEQIEMAGFHSAIGKKGEISRVLTIDEIVASEPDVIAVICCGYKIEENRSFVETLKNNSEINFLKPFASKNVYAFDSDSFFSRPTTRIIEGAEQLRDAILNK